jgi:hypothetical protein
MLSQGADSSSGDAYLPYYVQSSNNRLNPEHAVGSYYDYAVEMQPGSTGGKVHIFDPGFCDQGNFDLGTGDNYYSGSGAVSSFYTLWADDSGTPYNSADDRLVGSSGNTFRRQSGSCDAWHNAWYEVPLLSSQPEFTAGLSGGPGGRVYRLRASTYDPTDIAGQQRVRALRQRRGRHGAAHLRHRRHGDAHPAARRPDLDLLPGPDRGHPRGEDHGDQAVGPG